MPNVKKTYLDVNKEKYLKALFLDIEKQTKMVDLDSASKLVYDFVLNNPSNSDRERTHVNKDGLSVQNGCVIISKSSIKYKKKQK